MPTSRSGALPANSDTPLVGSTHPYRVPRVAVAVATYKRPTMLAALLESLRSLDAAPDTYRLRALVIVDNDVDESARSVVAQFQRSFPCDVIYECAPVRNIALARNAGVRRALSVGVDYIAFTDDDCVVASDWLYELVDAAAAYRADVVWGRLRHEYDARTPAWVVPGNFYGQPSRVTGTIMNTAESNNVMMRASLLRAMSEPFDPAFGISGGSDSLLFTRARQAGARIIWADEAVVTETVPLSRASTRWLLQRAYRMGNSGVYTFRAALPITRWLPQRIAKACGHIGIGLVTLPPAVLRGRTAVVRSLRRIALGAGIVTALLGIKYLEYRDVHGE